MKDFFFGKKNKEEPKESKDLNNKNPFLEDGKNAKENNNKNQQPNQSDQNGQVNQANQPPTTKTLITDTDSKMKSINIQLHEQLTLYRTAKNATKKAEHKRKATQLLKKKKMYENHMNMLSNTDFMMDNMMIETEIMKNNMQMLQVMKDTVQVQKDTIKSMGGINSMGDVMEDMREIQDEQAEINEDFMRNYEVDVGDDELDAELDEIDYEMKIEMNGEEMISGSGKVPQMSKDEADLERIMK